MFAPTPPLEAVRTILSMAATRSMWPHIKRLEELKVPDGHGERRVQVSVIDISRAYFNAKTKDEDRVYVELPEEDPDYGKGKCGKLLVHMYGTRKAADGWHGEYSETLEPMGFQRGVSSACVFWHPLKGLLSSVHGGDFTTAGTLKTIKKEEYSIGLSGGRRKVIATKLTRDNMRN